ncbi:MAG: imidazole glycerol phosphate synthase subunit HisH [Solirubrobacterales bacterium]
MISIIDYGMGNLRSVQKGLEKSGFEAMISTNPDEVAGADGVILPGVGAFRDAIANLKRTGMDQAVFEVVRRKRPLLGVCLGLQLLFSESEEDGIHEGLDLVQGRVIRFPAGRKVPHMGWNQLVQHGNCPLFAGIPDNAYFYFVHSFYCDPAESVTVGTCEYGLDFTCAIQKGNLFGVQFHPEKSSDLGLQILKNFGELL